MSEQAIPLEDDPRLTTYAIGEMDAGEIAEFEKLLAVSPEAQAEVEAIRALSETLGSEFSEELVSVGNESPAIAVAIDKPAVAKNVLRPPVWLFGAVGAGMAAMLTVTTLVHFKTSEPTPMSIVVEQAAPMAELESVKESKLKPLNKDADRSAGLFAEVEMPALAAATESLEGDLTSVGVELSKQPQSASAPVPAGSSAVSNVAETDSMFRRKAEHAVEVRDSSDLGLVMPAAVASAGSDAEAFVGGGAGSEIMKSQARTEGIAPVGSSQPGLATVGLEVQSATGRGQVNVSSTTATPEKAAESFGYSAGSKVVTSTKQTGGRAMPLAEVERQIEKIDLTLKTVPGSRPGSADVEQILEERHRLAEKKERILGRSQGSSGNRHAPLIDNVFKDPLDEELSTFSIDVDTASYALLRRSLMSDHRWPHRDQVRIEELINYFDYSYPAPDLEDVEAGHVAPFAVSVDAGAAPWAPKHRLVRIGLKSAELKGQRPAANLVFLVDVSGSMNRPDKLGLMQKSLNELVPQLGPDDRVTMVAYAGRAGEVLAPTAGDDHETIKAAIEALSAGGSTNGAGGIQVAYERAREHFVTDGVNRVILATDGDFNVGVSGDDELVQLVESQADSGVFLTVLGFGSGNLNDAMMEKITNKGNGNYFYIDRLAEGRKVLVEQMAGTLVTVASDVKIQVDFNPAKVASYRLIGYANRMLNREDFDDDKVDAGEIGAGHTVTALYEVVPVGVAQELTGAQEVDGLKYQRRLDEAAKQDLQAKRQETLQDRGIELVESQELLTVKLRYKRPAEDESALLEFPLLDRDVDDDGNVSDDFRFASAVAAFGMRLRDSRYIDKNFSLEAIAEIADAAKGEDPGGRRAELVEMIIRAAAVEPGAGDDVRRSVQERLEKLR